jgi:GH18 family chitinase
MGANWDLTSIAAWANPAGGSQRLLDQINVMCYDEDWGDNFSWYVGPLTHGGNNQGMTCDNEIKQFTTAGVAKHSLGVGMPFYGRRWPGVTKALQPSSFGSTINFSYRCLANDAMRWSPSSMKYDTKYNANYLSIANPAEFDSYTGKEFVRAAVDWGRDNGAIGGYMVFTLEYEYLGAPYGTAAWPNNACSNVTTGPAGNGAYPLSTALHRRVLLRYSANEPGRFVR